MTELLSCASLVGYWREMRPSDCQLQNYWKHTTSRYVDKYDITVIHIRPIQNG